MQQDTSPRVYHQSISSNIPKERSAFPSASMVNKPIAAKQHALNCTRSSYTCQRNKTSFSIRNHHGSEWLSQQGLTRE
ncbi:hypothetical protein Nepgr_022794 [Nepenthes gracilis]|uniref:Uncharacterized protein n=1 Tax=Nepenthes gracilis TaxID=150966 RepID=A0AAD3XX50_NEPGR|nr:hypothetical protein Nepgr_022794 [Nepenthes gracilis]